MSDAKNIYQVLDNELERLHRIMNRDYHSQTGGFQRYGSMQDNQFAYSRIQKIQDILLDAVKTHDALVQEKVAELAFTSVEDKK